MINKNHNISSDFADLFTDSPIERNKIDALVLAARFFEVINYVLDEKKMTRKSLAETIGKSASWLTQLLRGDKMPSLETITALGNALDIEFEVKSSNYSYNIAHIQPKSLINSFRELEAKKMEEVRVSTLNAFHKPKWDVDKSEIDKKEQEEFEPYSMTA